MSSIRPSLVVTLFALALKRQCLLGLRSITKQLTRASSEQIDQLINRSRHVFSQAFQPLRLIKGGEHYRTASSENQYNAQANP